MTPERSSHSNQREYIEPHRATTDELVDNLDSEPVYCNPDEYELLLELRRDTLDEIVDAINDRIATTAEQPHEWETAANYPWLDCDDDAVIHEVVNAGPWIDDIRRIVTDTDEIGQCSGADEFANLIFEVTDKVLEAATETTAAWLLTGDKVSTLTDNGIAARSMSDLIEPEQSQLTDFSDASEGNVSDRDAPVSGGSSIETVTATGIAHVDISGRVGGIHVLGVLHEQPLAIARLTGAITRYDPDVVAIEAKGEAIRQYHPDICDPRWPPRDELEAAAYATAQIEDLVIAGIDTQDYEANADFEQIDREIFTDLGIIDTADQLTLDSYYELDRPTIRKWRELTKKRVPEAFETVLAARDDVMAGHLCALYEQDSVETIVAVVGVQHLTGIIDRLRDPDRIPEQLVEHPPWNHYNILPPAPDGWE